jgi:hypothetical protein
MQNLFRFRLKNLSKGMAAAKEAQQFPETIGGCSVGLWGRWEEPSP